MRYATRQRHLRLPRVALVLAVSLATLVLPATALARPHPLRPDARVKAHLLSARPGVARLPARPRALPLRVRNPARLRVLKAAAARRVARNARSAGARTGVFARPLGSVSPGLSGSGLGAGQSGGDTPPDTTGAIGPSQYVEIVNDAVAVFDRTTLARVAGPVDNETFMGFTPSTPPTEAAFVTDPQMQWDPRSGRWFYLAAGITEVTATQDTVGPNSILFGWSKTADPTNLTSGWCNYSLPSDRTGTDSSLLDDYPKLGHDDTHLVFGSQLFDDPHGNNAISARIWVLPKPAAGDISTCPSAPTASTFGSPSTPLQTSGGNNAGIVIPANTFDASGGDYVVSANDPSDPSSSGVENRIMAWHATGSTGLTADGEFAVNPYGVPPSAPQPSTTFTLDTLDGRLTQAVALADPAAGGAEAVWTEQTVSDPGVSGGRALARWYELLPSSLTVRQQGDVGDPSGYAFNAAISPSANSGLTALFYNVSSSSSFPSIRARDRTAGLAPGALGDETTIATSSAADSDFSCRPINGGPPCRWGDYSGAAPDPSNASLVWGANQVLGTAVGSNPSWATQIFAFADAPPNAAFNPPAGSIGAPLVLDGSPSSDPDGHIAGYVWNFGDGATGGGPAPAIAHSYAKPGNYTVTLQVTSDSGQSATTSRVVSVADVPPQISGLRLTNKRFRVGKQRTVVSARASKRSKRGTAFVYSLSEAARMTFTIQRPLPGRRVGHSCKKQTRKNAKRHRCTRLKTVFTFFRRSAAGRNHKAFSGRAGRKSLRPGKYTARLIAVDSNGGRSPARSTRFTIVRR